jgi:hypothetical protein
MFSLLKKDHFCLSSPSVLEGGFWGKKRNPPSSFKLIQDLWPLGRRGD